MKNSIANSLLLLHLRMLVWIAERKKNYLSYYKYTYFIHFKLLIILYLSSIICISDINQTNMRDGLYSAESI